MRLTICTPTYNRKEELQPLFTSLQKQTNKDFCWLIVDDGSVDDTISVVKQMQKEATFPLEYVYQENQGKPFAFNKGVSLTKTDYFMSMDSDDFFTDDAVAIFYQTLEQVEAGKQFVGIVFQALDTNGKLLTKVNFPTSPWYSDFYTMLFEKGIFGDTAIFYQTDILSEHLFPRFSTEKFVPEALLLHRLAQIADFCFINKPVILKDYQADGFSNNMMDLYKNNPIGYFTYCLEVLNLHQTGLFQKMRHLAAVGVFGKMIDKKPKQIGKLLTKPLDRFLYYLLLPAIFVYKL